MPVIASQHIHLMLLPLYICFVWPTFTMNNLNCLELFLEVYNFNYMRIVSLLEMHIQVCKHLVFSHKDIRLL